MMKAGGRSKSAQHRKVAEARRVVAEALGDRLRRDAPENRTKYVAMKSPQPVRVKSEAIGVLSPGEVAARLGITEDDVRRLIGSGQIKSLPVGGYSVVVPTSEVERLGRPHESLMLNRSRTAYAISFNP